MFDDFSVLYGEIVGMLYALERVNSKTNVGYAFSLQFSAKDEKRNNQKIIEDYFKSVVKYSKLELEALQDWEATIRKELNYWLFAYLSKTHPTGTYLADIKNDYTFSREDGKNDFITELLQKIVNLVLPSTVWQLKIVPKEYYHAVDFALESANNIFFLHFEFYD